MYVCMRSENESSSHSSPPQLKRVRVICMCARVCVCWYCFANLSTLCSSTGAHCGTTNNLSHTSNTKNTGTCMSSNDRKSTLSLKHSVSVLSHVNHAHSLKRWKPVKKVRWQGRQLVVVQNKMPVSRRNRELGNQLQGILTKTNKERTNLYIHRHTSTHVGMYDCIRSEKSELGNQLTGILRKANQL
jgi:hypothetical protein